MNVRFLFNKFDLSNRFFTIIYTAKEFRIFLDLLAEPNQIERNLKNIEILKKFGPFRLTRKVLEFYFMSFNLKYKSI